ncbi:MAG: helix-turn-helix domain-containing protein [Shinella sp.]|uniref:helix-turn-helix domain-containing protein n=1 Tax=Shinella sp. TaxID=1870904 RepID=UPI0040374AAD
MTPEQSRAARGLLNWTQAELAKAATVGLSTVRSFETGTHTPVPNNLAAMRGALESAGVSFLADGDPSVGAGVSLHERL